MKRHQNQRQGASFIEVMAGLVLVSILFVPMFGILSACSRIWRQFESGHGATANRQMAIQEIDRRLRSAKQLESYSTETMVYLDNAGAKNQITRKQRLKPNGQLVYDLVRESLTGPAQTEVLAEEIGNLRIAMIRQTPAAGELLEIRIENSTGTVTTPRSHSSRYVWKRA
jgi:type II secretory pathway component PulJ